MRHAKTLMIVVVLTLLLSGYVFAGETETKTMPQQICPVMTFGELGCSVTKHDIHTDYNGKRIYFCSKGCLEKFTKDPEKYLKKAEEKGVEFEKVPETEINNESEPGKDTSTNQINTCGDCGCDS